jgi:CHASE2 domain-containing sensor protein/nitrogen-specific signal transduction histidine kinase
VSVNVSVNDSANARAIDPTPPASMRRLPSWCDEIVIAAVLAALAVALALGGWAWRLDRLVYDLGLTLWSQPAPADIVIIAIDDDSLEAIGRWPWRRAVHASLIERLAQAQPKAVALDIVFSEPDPDPEQDRLLARALARSAARNVPLVVPVTWQESYGPAMAVTLPVPLLREQVRMGASENPVDIDGVLRSAFLKAGPRDGALYAHVALALLEAGGGQVHPGLRVETANSDGPAPGPQKNRASGRIQREGRFLIRFVGPPGTVRQVSYADVLRGAVPASQLAGRFVFVGMTAKGLYDTLATPVNGQHEAMAGVEVLANVLHTLRSGDSIATVSVWLVAALSTLLLAALLGSFAMFGPRRALPTAVAAVPLAVLASLWALRSGLWVSPIPFALPAALAYPLWSWRRLERAVAGLDQEIARLAAEPLVAANNLPGLAPVTGGRVDDARDDIDARLHTLRRAGTVVRQAQRFLADSLAALPTAMLLADDGGRVLLANPRAAAVFDVESAEELQGLDLARLLAEFSTPTPFDWPAAAAALAPGGAGVAVEGTLANASAVPGAATGAGDFVVHLAAVDLQGQRRLIVTIADIAPVKHAQREREEALAFVTHDLRSPASSIVLLADLNLRQQPVAAPEELLREVRRLAVRTLSLSEEFVRVAQVQSLPLQRVEVSLQALLDDALADLQAQAQAAAVALRCTLQGRDDTNLLLDRPLVARAIANLVSNAIKHSPSGAEVLVTAGVLDASQSLVVGVRDRGPGLSAGQLAQLARGDQGALVRDARGVGLGLLFVQRVARRHGGSLQAHTPADGGGALFELTVPTLGP